MTGKTTGILSYLREELPLEDVSCLMCDHDVYDVIESSPPFTVARCNQCSFVYVTPRIPESHLHLVYAWDYYDSGNPADYGYDKYLEDGELHKRTFAMKADFVQRHKKSGRLLEVGSAGGFFLKEMQRRGFKVEGIEISEKAAQFSRDVLGLKTIHTSKLEDAPVKGPFDVIALWDVIEHVSDPLKTMQHLRKLIAPDGVLIIQTQNIDSMFAKLLGQRWHHFKHLEHIYHFSPETMNDALTASGFEISELTAKGSGKYISGQFFIDRMRRISPTAHFCLKPFKFLGGLAFYVNLRDEFIVAAKPTIEEKTMEAMG